jgi:hypothetical protein
LNLQLGPDFFILQRPGGDFLLYIHLFLYSFFNRGAPTLYLFNNMQLHHSLVSLLAVLYILEPAFAAAIFRTHAHLSLDPSLAPLKRSLDARMAGLRFFRRKATAAFVCILERTLCHSSNNIHPA